MTSFACVPVSVWFSCGLLCYVRRLASLEWVNEGVFLPRLQTHVTPVLTHSKGYGFPSCHPLTLLPACQHPLQQHLSQLLLPWMLSLYQRYTLSQRWPLTPDEAVVQPLECRPLSDRQIWQTTAQSLLGRQVPPLRRDKDGSMTQLCAGPLKDPKGVCWWAQSSDTI